MRDVIEIIRRRLALHAPLAIAQDSRRAAAVLIPLYSHGGALHIVFTRRADNLKHHSGEISFPGGSREPADADLLTTALRESWEEIGIDAGHVEVLGQIDDFVTGSNFHISPFVGLLDDRFSPYPWHPDESEVAEMIEVPLIHLLDPLSQDVIVREVEGGVMVREAYRFGEHLIWGATARMLHNFLDVIGEDRMYPGLKAGS